MKSLPSSSYLYAVFFATIFCSCNSQPLSENPDVMVAVKQEKQHLIDGELHFVDGYPAILPNGDVNVVIEIPTGSDEKWEVDKASGDLKWEIRNGRPRVVSYIGYPGNYGMIPQTLLPKELGGDGDPLDVIVLGPAVERGKVIPCKIIGVMKLMDNGEQDDKLIAVMPNTDFYPANSLEQLDSTHNGIDEIIQLWFSNYKGPGQMEFAGFENRDSANSILKAAMKAYADRNQ